VRPCRIPGGLGMAARDRCLGGLGPQGSGVAVQKPGGLGVATQDRRLGGLGPRAQTCPCRIPGGLTLGIAMQKPWGAQARPRRIPTRGFGCAGFQAWGLRHLGLTETGRTGSHPGEPGSPGAGCSRTGSEPAPGLRRSHAGSQPGGPRPRRIPAWGARPLERTKAFLRRISAWPGGLGHGRAFS